MAAAAHRRARIQRRLNPGSRVRQEEGSSGGISSVFVGLSTGNNVAGSVMAAGTSVVGGGGCWNRRARRLCGRSATRPNHAARHARVAGRIWLKCQFAARTLRPVPLSAEPQAAGAARSRLTVRAAVMDEARGLASSIARTGKQVKPPCAHATDFCHPSGDAESHNVAAACLPPAAECACGAAAATLMGLPPPTGCVPIYKARRLHVASAGARYVGLLRVVTSSTSSAPTWSQRREVCACVHPRSAPLPFLTTRLTPRDPWPPDQTHPYMAWPGAPTGTICVYCGRDLPVDKRTPAMVAEHVGKCGPRW